MLTRLRPLAPRFLDSRVTTPVAMLYDPPAPRMWEEPSPWNGPSSLCLDGNPASVEISSRVTADGKRYIFLLNTLGRPVEVSVSGAFYYLWQDREHQGTVLLTP